LGNSNKIIIAGSGLVGSLWAYILKMRGHDVKVYEKRSDPRLLEAPAGRSINLVITSRGLRGLEVAGLLQKILPITVPVYGRQIHTVSGESIFQPYGRDKSECNYSVSRWDLNKALIQACVDAGVEIHFDHSVEKIDSDKKKITFRYNSASVEKNYSVLFATDGAGSVIRKSLIKNNPNDFQESVDWLDSDYKELYLPKLSNDNPALEKNALHIWPRGSHMMMGLANADNSFTMTLYLPKENQTFAFANLKNESDVTHLFQSEFADAIPLLPNYKKDFLTNPQGKLATVRLNRWIFQDSIALMGDAAHAIVPFFGQGMNLGFEDCTTLLKCFEDSQNNWGLAFAKYNQQQRPNANAIAEMALENFIEMRDKVGDSKFQFKKKMEGLLEKNFPEFYRSRYGLITYTLTPYSIAQEAGIRQNALLEKLAIGLSAPEQLNLDQARKVLEADFYPWLLSKGVESSTYRPITS
jgi:kynurenine 3-monooxygenase